MAALRPQAFVSQADLDLAETSYRDAEANVEVLQAELDKADAALASAELDLGYTTIHSPVNGIVVSRNVDVGQTIAAQFQTPILFVIAQDLTQMQVNANVSESDIGGVTEGTEASFRVDAYPKQFFTGRVTQVRNAPVSIQNVVEAVIMTAIGGALGVAAGIGAARVLTAMIGWPTIINTQAVAAAFVFSLIVGVFFGLYPANKASKLNPIEALHYE
ncbi:hypothetical protein NITMOv2_3864 [Nitrospira moscoviensis]|uniref:Uncharacterized protein n=1 Tax=Nitrospira moscoviensis TaxID=42253 RepID=A0A0K2GH33_NITMO|nr:efflux RND transporter periplasmic adaptor subunit [Nitrospira moscoviensis]ALA60251.1 hypothetical protein NITMOv2_3864 [Nitrospira moscoviensis]